MQNFIQHFQLNEQINFQFFVKYDSQKSFKTETAFGGSVTILVWKLAIFGTGNDL